MKLHPIRRYCRERGLTQVEFADLVGLSESFICDMIAGRKWPSYPVARRISQRTRGDIGIGDLLAWRRAA